MAEIKAVLFDLDGTLTDTLQDLTQAVNHALQENGMPTRTLQEVRKMVGNGVYSLIARAVQTGSSETQVQQVFASFTAFYAKHATDTTCPYPGVRELLHTLKNAGMQLAVLSNKLDAPTKAIVERFFPGVFTVVFGQRQGVPKKPDPTAVREALSLLGVTEEECVYVGDSEVDVQTAKNAGISCFAVSWGFRDKEELISAGATRIYKNAQELLLALLPCAC